MRASIPSVGGVEYHRRATPGIADPEGCRFDGSMSGLSSMMGNDPDLMYSLIARARTIVNEDFGVAGLARAR
jgi:hypothetical protein